MFFMITFSFQNSWKDPNNDFRTNLKITAVPTLLKYGTVSIFNYVGATVHPVTTLLTRSGFRYGKVLTFHSNITVLFRVHLSIPYGQSQ